MGEALSPSEQAAPPLVAEGLWFSYPGCEPALRGVSIQVHPGETVAIIGQNGSGKTTLAKHFNGLLRPSRGRVLLYGEDIVHSTTGELSRVVGYLFQNPDHQIFSATVRDEIAFGLRNLGLSNREVAQRVEAYLSRFGLAGCADWPPALLSYGLRRKVTLAAVLAMEPQILVLDEPTGGLDWSSRQHLVEQLRKLQRAGGSIVLLTHDMPLVAEQAQRCVILNQGAPVADESPRALFAQADRLRRLCLGRPQVTELASSLAPLGMRETVLTVQEFCDSYLRLLPVPE